MAGSIRRRRLAVLTVAAILLPICAFTYVTFLVVCLLTGTPQGAVPADPIFALDESFEVEKQTPDGVAYTVNNSTASFDADVQPPDPHCSRVFQDYGEVLRYGSFHGLQILPSVQLVQAKCKQIDDRVCATLESAIQRGIVGASFPGKRETLLRLLEALCEMRASPQMPSDAASAFDGAIVHVATALSLGELATETGPGAEVDPSLAPRVASTRSAFLGSALESRPVGFWSESEDLRAIFLQDRFLMRGFNGSANLAPAMAIGCALAAEPGLLDAIESFGEIDAKLTNPCVYMDTGRDVVLQARLVPWRDLVRRVAPPGTTKEGALLAVRPDSVKRIAREIAAEHGPDAGFALVAYSTSKEYALLQSLAEKARLSGAEATMNLVIDAVKSGRLSLEPGPDSGWYDYQWYALETLLLPERGQESAKLALSEAYRERLRIAFATMLTKIRETHIKHLPVMTICKTIGDPESPPKVEIGPELSLEPTATVYLRLGRGYRFLRNVLEAAVGSDALRGIRPPDAVSGREGKDLDRELEDAALLCYGLYEVACREIGQRVQYLENEVERARSEWAKEAANAWLSSLDADEDLAADTRVAAPVLQRDDGTLVHWASCGVRLDRLVFEYDREPTIEGRIEAVLIPSRYYAPSDVFVEFATKDGRPMTREELRGLCDGADDESGIRRALGAPLRSTDWSDTGWETALVAFGVLGGAMLLVRWRRQRREAGGRRRRLLTRRRVLATTGVVLLAFALWVVALCLLPGYRVRILVTQLATRNENLAILCQCNWVYRVHPRHKIPALVDLLEEEDAQVRYLAARFLLDCRSDDLDPAELGPEEARLLAILQKASQDAVPEVATYATAILGWFRSPGNLEFLLDRLDEARPMDALCASALYAIADIGDARALDRVLPFTGDPRLLVRSAAIESLSSYDDRRVDNRLRELLQSDDSNDAVLAAWTIEVLTAYDPDRSDGPPEGRFDTDLLRAAEHANLPAWQRLQFPESIVDPALRAKAFLAIVRSPSPDEDGSLEECRSWAAESLESMARVEPAARSVIAEASQDSDEAVREAVQQARRAAGEEPDSE